MIFLIEYHRRAGRLASFRSFEDSERQLAEDSRLELELALTRAGVNHEVVLLQAPTEADIRRTHRRYFEDLRHLVGLNGEGDS